VTTGIPDLRQKSNAAGLLRLHEDLIRLNAYPPDRATLSSVRKALSHFPARRDLARFRDGLRDTGVAGTTIGFSFFWSTAKWLVERWPDQIRIDWDSYTEADRLEGFLHLLLPFTESIAIDDLAMSPEDWLDNFKDPAETDAAFLVRRVAAAPVGDDWREKLYEELGIPLIIDPAPGTPNRTEARYPGIPASYQTEPLDATRPDLPTEIARPPRKTTTVSRREGQRLIDMAREAMVTRSRDLDVFVNADPADVQLIEDGGGLWFAAMGLLPEKRHMLETVQGFLILRSGVPLGYVLNTSLFNTSEVALNIFDTFRGGETGRIYGRVLAMLRQRYHSDVFVVPPYQLGHENEEGLLSGAWWFYYKLGFRPVDREVRRLVRREVQCLQRRPTYRSSLETLNQLASENMYWYLEGTRTDVFGRLVLGRVGIVVSHYLSDRFGADRELGMQVCATEAGELLGLESLKGFSKGERLAWTRWGPVVMSLPGVQGWSVGERSELVDVIRAKGGKREIEYTLLFDRHVRLRAALVEMQRS
jgi:hypothetical protein